MTMAIFKKSQSDYIAEIKFDQGGRLPGDFLTSKEVKEFRAYLVKYYGLQTKQD